MKRLKIIWPQELLPNVSDSLCVVIDVNAATTNLAILLTKKVKKIIIANELNLLSLKKKYPDVFIIGESKTLPKELFDASNLPLDCIKLNLYKKIVLYMSNNGSKVIETLFQRRAKKIITASFVNINCVAHYLEKINGSILLIPAGEDSFPHKIAKEDLYCAQALKKLVVGEKINLKDYLKKSKEFILSKYPWKNQKLASKVVKIELALDSYPLIPSCSLAKDQTLVVSHDLIS